MRTKPLDSITLRVLHWGGLLEGKPVDATPNDAKTNNESEKVPEYGYWYG